MKIKRVDVIIIAVLILIIAAGLVVPALSGAGSRQGSSQAAGSEKADSKEAGSEKAGSEEAGSKDAGDGESGSADPTGTETTDSESNAISYEDYNGKKIGILTGTNMEQESFKYFPDSEYFYYDGYPGLNIALDAGLIDAYLGDEPALRCIHAAQPQIDYIRERLTNNSYSFAFRKDDEKEKKLCDQFNQFLRDIKADGTYDEIDATWFGADEDKKFVDMSGLTGENGTIHVITTSTDEPFSYIKDGKHVGYDIDVAVRFCRAYGYRIEIGDVDFRARIPALMSGKYEFTTSLNVTPEREESVLFSEPVSSGGIVVAVRTEDMVAAGVYTAGADGASSPSLKKGFFERISESFEKNFIREKRWELILEGIRVTCLITVMSAFFGTILAFLICMFRRTDSMLANPVCDIYVSVMQGLPMLVVLMMLYYVVFGRIGVKAVWVAVIGFSLNVGAYGSEIMRSGIESIDPGQREAAIALGFTERQTFFNFIFPQAAVHFLPVYRGELVSLLKSTSIVGYIAIRDLTKMSDIIRSRTYEAFFPLLATALIYFILTWIISLLMELLLKRIDWKHGREEIPFLQNPVGKEVER